MRKYIFNPINDKVPSGAVEKNTEVKYTLRVSKFENPECAFFVVHTDGNEPVYREMIREYVDDKYVNYTYTCKYDSVGFFWYHFKVKFKDNQIKLIHSDSLDVVELVMSFEDEFGIALPDEDVAKLKTIKDIVDYISNLKK